jgi:hypothetical protein
MPNRSPPQKGACPEHAHQKHDRAEDSHQRLTTMLRCASGHGCHLAVACSDKAMHLLRKLVTKPVR